MLLASVPRFCSPLPCLPSAHCFRSVRMRIPIAACRWGMLRAPPRRSHRLRGRTRSPDPTGRASQQTARACFMLRSHRLSHTGEHKGEGISRCSALRSHTNASTRGPSGKYTLISIYAFIKAVRMFRQATCRPTPLQLRFGPSPHMSRCGLVSPPYSPPIPARVLHGCGPD